PAARPRFPHFSEEDDDFQYADHDYEVSQQRSLKKICNRVKWTRDENRSDFQCQHRWQKVLNPELIKGPWTKEEDQRVMRTN
uniref:HTH myb-type domain-containing protein n=1 Tax=Pavo cristatus TaxID=9049 RepID=A0A8C9FX39_PAVCR